MPCDAIVFLIVSIDHFMPQIQDKRGNSSCACARIYFEHSVYKAFA